ncbi:3-hydroxyisobutyrate dehydrogenase [Edaphobacter dinghuensis]|uniref:3-hydroxyisobutyrate dehydrogenase n=2 Tax=Edaphobacter dinghuensis TaxID=1560005 RepID=A0A917H026_9BACT|nr:3-hydroxyisobutyrate dehydrogenase [Edaphobacter dinghuensis]
MSKDVALLGLGTMGTGMAENLLKAGFSLTVYNRTPEKAQALIGDGARFVSTPSEAARDAAVVISMLADDAASRDVWMGSNGALTTTKKETILVESSTVSPAWIAELASLASRKGAKLLDAPVTGSRVQAKLGQLSFLVGGDDATLKGAMPILKAMSKEIIHLGPIGSGAKMKLINNFLCGVQVASLAEGLTWIERSGLNVEKALAILKAGAPGSPLFSAVSARMTERDYSVNFSLKLMEKDLRYAEVEAAQNHVSLKTAKAARCLFEMAAAKGFADKDMSSVIELLRDKITPIQIEKQIC